MNIETFEVEMEYENERLDKYLSLIFSKSGHAIALFFSKIDQRGACACGRCASESQLSSA